MTNAELAKMQIIAADMNVIDLQNSVAGLAAIMLKDKTKLYLAATFTELKDVWSVRLISITSSKSMNVEKKIFDFLERNKELNDALFLANMIEALSECESLQEAKDALVNY